MTAEIEGFIREAARVRGIDPDAAVLVALQDVSPRLAGQDMLDGFDTGGVLGGESFGADPSGSIARTDRPYLIFGEPRLPMSDTARVSCLVNHVSVIIRERSEKQMVRTDARAVVAAVQDIQPRRDLSEVQAPRDTVHAVAGESAIRPAYLDMAVAGTLADAAGFPAAVSLDDPSPESRCQVLLGEAACGIMNMHQITPDVVPSAVDAARGLLDEILP